MTKKKPRLMRLKKALLTKQDVLEQRFASYQRHLLEVQDETGKIESAMARPVVMMFDVWRSGTSRIDALRQKESAMRHELHALVQEMACVRSQLRRTDATLDEIASVEGRKALLDSLSEYVATQLD